MHQNSVSSVCQKKKNWTFYAPFTRGREQVHIYFVPTNILKIRNTSLRQNGFTNDLHKNEFCSCFMNEAQVVFLLVFLLTYIVGSRSWFWEQCCWTWLWKSTDMNSVILMMPAYISNMMFSMIWDDDELVSESRWISRALIYQQCLCTDVCVMSA